MKLRVFGLFPQPKSLRPISNGSARHLTNCCSGVDDFVGPNLDALPENALGFLKESVSTLPGSPRIYLVGADGNTRLTTDPDFKPIDIRDRDYFQAVAKGAATYISPMLVSRLNGEQIFVISKRVERGGAFVGAAIVSFNSQLIEKVWNSLRFDPTSTVSVVREDGLIVARYPLLEGSMNISDSALFTTYLPQTPNGTYEAISVADGLKRIVAYRRVEGSKLIAIASIGHDVAFAPFYNFSHFESRRSDPHCSVSRGSCLDYIPMAGRGCPATGPTGRGARVQPDAFPGDSPPGEKQPAGGQFARQSAKDRSQCKTGNDTSHPGDGCRT